ncbi:hypothetical protein JVT61DRAFT_1910 [Boletus reticuloceps]|uniref:HMG box domain-containing protein n=1 Tax=Boletus reticuloceps TaxID=495285 RepID=A0A8I2YBV7_9AGAM|nr:hypothetical protein JVT61DRAFT_1910 [Boletus reticuloceps]
MDTAIRSSVLILIKSQVLSGKPPWSEIREDMAVVLQLARGHKPGRPVSRTLDDAHWGFIQQCWSAIEERPVAQVAVHAMKQFLSKYPTFRSLSDSLLSGLSRDGLARESSSSTMEDSISHVTHSTVGPTSMGLSGPPLSVAQGAIAPYLTAQGGAFRQQQAMNAASRSLGYETRHHPGWHDVTLGPLNSQAVEFYGGPGPLDGSWGATYDATIVADEVDMSAIPPLELTDTIQPPSLAIVSSTPRAISFSFNQTETSPDYSSPTSSPFDRPKKGDEYVIKRSENAFILFRRQCCEDRQAAAKEAPAADGPNLSKMISQQWKALSPEERQYWEELAKKKKWEHEQMYPNYVYRPQHYEKVATTA